jgi:hypothetical protein
LLFRLRWLAIGQLAGASPYRKRLGGGPSSARGPGRSLHEAISVSAYGHQKNGSPSYPGSEKSKNNPMQSKERVPATKSWI